MGYDLLEVLDEDGDRTLVRGRRRDDDAPVLVTWLAGDDPGAADRLRRAAELAQQVVAAGPKPNPDAAQPLAHGRGDGGSWLVCPDPGGVPLSRLLADGPLPVVVALEVALQLSAALGRVHAAGVLHRDVRPAHVLVDLSGRRAALIGAHAAAPADATAPLAIAAAALPYVAPEMTGRTGQACDYRSDYYSLGATLYHALTGQPPFSDDDPMRVIHGHIARAPVPPATVRPDLPRALSKIVLKLLAKQPGERYQSSRGLGRDLIRCLREFTDRGAVDDFTPGLEDTSERLRLPDALYGRDAPLADLQALFARAAAGEVALALVTGPSGVGKSAVVRAAREQIAAGGGRIAAGACTRFHQTAPFHVLAEALREFFAHALAGPGRALHYWRELLLAALAGEGALLTDIIPGLLPVLGPQPAVAPLPPVERANRFRHVLRRLLTALARPQHPLVVVLDDLQWCDPATLQLLGDLLTADDLHHLLVLATVRDGEEAGNQALTAVLAELANSGHTARRLPLAPLTRADIDAWLTAAVRPCPQDLSGLVDIIATSTGGNPFLARLLVQSLHEQQVIRFDPEQGVWQWRAGLTAAAKIPDDIGALVSQRIDQLSAPARAALTTAACIGPRFELALLASLLGVPTGSAAAAIREAEARGLVLPASDDDAAPARLVYCFLHPRVHQAAYAALPPSRTPALHLAIGRALALLPDDLGFEVIGHLNLGAALIEAPAERAALARRNLDAARRSLAATAWDSAARYARAGLDVLGDMPDRSELRWLLGRALIEARYMGGDPVEGSALVARMLDDARDEVARAELVDLKLGLDIFHGRHLEAIAAGVDALARLGVTLPADPAPTEIAAGLARVELLLAGRDLVEIADLPEADDPRTVAALQLLMDTGPAAMFVRGRLAFAIFLAIVELSLARGATRATGYGVAGYGMFLACSLGQHIEAGILGHVALRLNQRVGDPALAAKIHQLVGGLILPWTRPIPTCVELLEQGTRLGVATGDLPSALYNATSVVLLHVARNASLFDVRRAAESFLQSSGRMATVHGSGVFHMALRLCRCLTGELPEPTPHTAARWLAEVWDAEPDPRATALTLLYDNIFCTLALTVFGCHAAVRPLAPQAAERLAALAPPTAVDAFYLHALCRCLSLPPDAHLHDLADVETTHARLATWAAACPENFAARYALLTAELARVKGSEQEAAEHYKKAIRTARKHGEAGTEALACELAGRQCAADGDDVLADMYFRTASEVYARWGATAKAQALQREHGLRPRRTGEPERAATGLADALDLRTLIKASRAISSEIQLDRLLRTLLGVVMENAGAARGLVVFVTEGRLTVEAEGSVDPPDIHVLQGTPLDQHPWIAQSVVHYVVRSQQDVLLARAAHEGDFRGDPYIAEQQVLSIVCTPVLHQGRCTGAVYLEHASSEGVFTAARLELLKQLAAQLAVSVENARLYDDLSRARKEAIAAEQVKARFLMNMSHELRTPLNAVIGYAELMQENLALGLYDSFGDDLARISRAARNLLRTLSGILELSKLAGGTSFVERAAVDVEALIREIVAEHEAAAAARGNVIETRGELHGPIVTDRSMLRYCLNSLLDNAIKFTLGGRIAVEAAREHDTDRAWLALRVRDTGIGIPESSFNAIFGAFTQVNDAASRSYEGAGVGLAVARQFSRLIGGDLTVASEVGRGSTFTLKIPVR